MLPLKLKNKKGSPVRYNAVAHVPSRCRCGGEPSKPVLVKGCENRWSIQCKVDTCQARNTGQGLSDTILGWNRLSTHFYR
jgi:hypothetical protein